MSHIVLRRTQQSTVSPEEAVAVVNGLPRWKVLHHSGNNVLAEASDLSLLDALQCQLAGWIISLQGPKIRVPDTRLKVRTAGR